MKDLHLHCYRIHRTTSVKELVDLCVKNSDRIFETNEDILIARLKEKQVFKEDNLNISTKCKQIYYKE